MRVLIMQVLVTANSKMAFFYFQSQYICLYYSQTPKSKYNYKRKRKRREYIFLLFVYNFGLSCDVI